MADLVPTAPGDINLDPSNEPVFLRSRPAEVLKITILGALAGLLTAALSWVLEHFVLQPIFCGSASSSGVCAKAGSIAYYAAAVLVSIVATIILANWQIFRPLPLVVAVLATLWGLQKYLGNVAAHGPFEYYLYTALLFSLCYLLFYWLLRLHNFVVSILFVIVAVVGIRLLLVS